MELKVVLSLLMTLATYVHRAEAFGSGAPSGRCSDMLPNHGVPPEETPSPFMVMIDGDNYYMYGTPKMITIKSAAGTPFRGLLCQMRKASDPNVAVGNFSLMANENNLQLLGCGGVPATGVTHSNNADKPMVQFYWMPPATDMGDVKVMCTVVQEFQMFWTQVLSPTLMYSMMDNNPPMDDATTPIMMKPSTMMMKPSTMMMKPSTMMMNNNDDDDNKDPYPDNGTSTTAGHTMLLGVLLLAVTSLRKLI